MSSEIREYFHNNTEPNQKTFGIFLVICKSYSDSDNIYDHHTAAISSSRPQTPSPTKEEDEEESQTDQQGSYESNANVELK